MRSPVWVSTLLFMVFLYGSALPHIKIPPLRPGSAVRQLATSIDEEIIMLDVHARELGIFNSKLRSLKCKSLTLSRELRQADDAFMWSDRHTWFRYISRLKRIWHDARDHQRAIDALKKCMQDVIFAVEEERSCAEAEIARRRESAAVFDTPSLWSYQDLEAAILPKDRNEPTVCTEQRKIKIAAYQTGYHVCRNRQSFWSQFGVEFVT
ncbi:hypothetical protein IW261DRAFT_1413951 [Armillaria novae-zelandiae]|uniref:Uncharacterized protein n=1 Tax=Armillaria novae-zelandiae TaxID=153914 RepID=A0AA39PQ09_9AGAR|nr:hypothetical protein IW261DRAFT_1413951 [Armillaria novae-zelandiae]